MSRCDVASAVAVAVAAPVLLAGHHCFEVEGLAVWRREDAAEVEENQCLLKLWRRVAEVAVGEYLILGMKQLRMKILHPNPVKTSDQADAQVEVEEGDHNSD